MVGTYGFRKPKQKEATVHIEGVGDVKKVDVMHVLMQEMQRQADWQKNPPERPSTAEEMETLGQDDQWQVLTLALPSSGKAPALIITYGEMNTLADFYGIWRP